MKPISPQLKKQFTDYCDFSLAQLEQLAQYAAMLEQWQKAINLVSPKTIDDLWQRHLLDSAQLWPVIKSLPFAGDGYTITDLGSGGGLPGIVLAIATGQSVTMVESDKRKCIFLKEVARSLKLDRVHVINERIETQKVGKADIITARALAPLSQLITWARPLIKEKGFLVFLKGADVEKELAGFDHTAIGKFELYPSLTDPQAKIFVAHSA